MMDHKFPFDHFLKFGPEVNSPSPGEMSDLSSEIHDFPVVSEKITSLASFFDHSSLKKNIQESNETTYEEVIDTVAVESPASSQLSEINKQLLLILKDLINGQKFDAYFKDSFHIHQYDDSKIIFHVSTNFIKTMIESQYLPHLEESIKAVLSRPLAIEIRVRGHSFGHFQTQSPLIENVANPPSAVASFSLPPTSPSNKRNKKPSSAKEARFQLDLIPSQEDLIDQVNSTVLSHMEGRYYGNYIDHNKTFENFIVGPSNNMAHASAYAVTKNPGKVYPSLYIHGPSGLGKTHLLHAVANKLKEAHPNLKMHLTTARDFMTEMIDYLTNKRVNDFRKKYSEQIDVLMIDDVHELKNKSGTQNEFFHIFNELYNKGKQLIFTSDKPPKMIDGLEERIKTRLSWGLVLDIQEPDFETRMAILKKKVHEEDLYLPDDVVHLIASSVKGNIRELEGSLIRLGAYSSVMKIDIDIDIAKEQLKIIESNTPKKLDMEAIAKSVSTHFKIPIADICSKARIKRVTQARHVAMYLSHKVLQETLNSIAKYFGKRDHTSVIHAIEKVKNQIQADNELQQIVSDIESAL